MKRILTVCIAMILVCSGCAWFEVKEEEKAEQNLASYGMLEFERGNYRKALESFERLRDWYPFGEFAILARLKIADAHYRLREYEEAIFAYEEFKNLHPRNEAIPYVIYQIGRCYFAHIDTVDRDQTPARKALSTFRRLEKQFPESPYADRAKEHIKECLKSLAGHELYVGLFYYRGGRYRAALARFKTVVSDYPDVGFCQKALQYIGMSKARLKDKEAPLQH